MKYIIGIDPDSDRHGVAVYVDGKLHKMLGFTLIELWTHISVLGSDDIEVHMENVCGNNAAFQKKGIHNARAGNNVARSLGKCQQSQVELERLFKHMGIKVVLHPISKNWKDSKIGKKAFEHYTGWSKQSNEDTRSAAYFGWLGCQYGIS